MKKLLASMVILGGLSGVAMAQPYPYPNPYPPPPGLYHEMVPPPPGRHMMWQPGHWQWNGHRYVWVRGHYVQTRPQHRRWVHGHWEHGRHGWRWVEGHWR